MSHTCIPPSSVRHDDDALTSKDALNSREVSPHCGKGVQHSANGISRSDGSTYERATRTRCRRGRYLNDEVCIVSRLRTRSCANKWMHALRAKAALLKELRAFKAKDAQIILH